MCEAPVDNVPPVLTLLNRNFIAITLSGRCAGTVIASHKSLRAEARGDKVCVVGVGGWGRESGLVPPKVVV